MKKEIKMNREWAMPSMHTFTIKPITELLKRYNVGENWVDPFAGENSPAEYTNDHNPEKPTTHHMEAIDFVNQFGLSKCCKEQLIFQPRRKESKYGGYYFCSKCGADSEDKKFDGALFDPPYSYRQVSEHYKVLGKKATQLDTSTNFYNRVLNPLADIIKVGGHCIGFGWNSNGMGKNRGFEIVEILLVAHGGHHNDTICTVEVKV